MGSSKLWDFGSHYPDQACPSITDTFPESLSVTDCSHVCKYEIETYQMAISFENWRAGLPERTIILTGRRSWSCHSSLVRIAERAEAPSTFFQGQFLATDTCHLLDFFGWWCFLCSICSRYLRSLRFEIVWGCVLSSPDPSFFWRTFSKPMSSQRPTLPIVLPFCDPIFNRDGTWGCACCLWSSGSPDVGGMEVRAGTHMVDLCSELKRRCFPSIVWTFEIKSQCSRHEPFVYESPNKKLTDFLAIVAHLTGS